MYSFHSRHIARAIHFSALNQLFANTKIFSAHRDQFLSKRFSLATHLLAGYGDRVFFERLLDTIPTSTNGANLRVRGIMSTEELAGCVLFVCSLRAELPRP